MTHDNEIHESCGNVFLDIGFSPVEAEELTAKMIMIIAIKRLITKQELTQKQAAALCGTDQPTLSKVMRNRMDSVTIDRLASWLMALGQDVQIVISPAGELQKGRLMVEFAAT